MTLAGVAALSRVWGEDKGTCAAGKTDVAVEEAETRV